MRILLVKTSSLGDVIHNLPVVSDIRRQIPDATVDWCVEESFAAIPRLHPGRRGGHSGGGSALAQGASQGGDLAGNRRFPVGSCRRCCYDAVIDTQGLLKSALIASPGARSAFGLRRRLGARVRLPRVSMIAISACRGRRHAVVRNRDAGRGRARLRAPGEPDYGIAAPAVAFRAGCRPVRYVVFLTATSRDDKLWPESHWTTLGRQLQALGYRLVLPGGNPAGTRTGSPAGGGDSRCACGAAAVDRRTGLAARRRAGRRRRRHRAEPSGGRAQDADRGLVHGHRPGTDRRSGQRLLPESRRQGADAVVRRRA